MERTLNILKRLGAAPRQFGEILRHFGNLETSRLALLGALFWFVMFGGMWLMMVTDFVAAWLGVPIAIWPADIGPVTLKDLISGTLIASLMVFLTGNFLYGRFFISRANVEAMTETWTDFTWERYTYLQSNSGQYSWSGLRWVLKISGVLGLLMMLSWLFLPFVE